MTDIVAFLTARLVEDEASANAAAAAPVAARYASGADIGPAVGRLMFHRRFDATHVLADVAAKRERLRMHVEQQRMLKHIHTYSDQFTHDTKIVAAASAGVLEAVVRQDAAVYAEHPDYDPAWRVQ